MAIARRILVAVYHILHDPVPYRELGASYRPSPDVTRRVRRLVAQLQQLGQEVTVRPTETAA